MNLKYKIMLKWPQNVSQLNKIVSKVWVGGWPGIFPQVFVVYFDQCLGAAHSKRW